MRANFLEFSPAGCEGSDAHDDPGNARIAGGVIDRVGVIVQYRNGVPAEGAEEIRGALFFDLALRVDHQHRI